MKSLTFLHFYNVWMAMTVTVLLVQLSVTTLAMETKEKEEDTVVTQSNHNNNNNFNNDNNILLDSIHSYLEPFTVSNLDVLHDGKTRNALKQLRTQKYNTREEEIPLSEGELLEGLEALLPAGNGDFTAMSLRGSGNNNSNNDGQQRRKHPKYDSTLSIVISPFLQPIKMPTTTTTTTTATRTSSTTNTNNRISQLIGVFDGHFPNSYPTSQYAAKELPKRLAYELLSLEEQYGSEILFGNNNDNNKDNMTKEEEEELLLLQQEQKSDNLIREAITKAFRWVDQTEPSKGNSGCSASILLQLNHKIYMANVGTSQIFVGVFLDTTTTTTNDKNNDLNDEEWIMAEKYNDVAVILETPITVPSIPAESKRILEMGSIIEKEKNDNNNEDGDEDDENESKLKEEEEESEEILKVYPPKNSTMHRTHPGITSSRSIGDWNQLPGVIADPRIGIFTLDEIREFASEYHSEVTCTTRAAEEEDESHDEYSDDNDDEEKEEETDRTVTNNNNNNNDDEESTSSSSSSFVCPAPKSFSIFCVAATEAVLKFPESLSIQNIAKMYAASFFVDGNPHPHTASEAVLLEAAYAWDGAYEGQFRDDMAIAAAKIWNA